MRMIRTLLAALTMLAVTPAWADTTALYKAPQGGQMNIEVASNGNMRATMGAGGTYMLTVQGEDYMVFYTDKGAVVARMSDVGAVMLDHIRQKMPQMLEAPENDDGAPWKYFQGGQMTVGGRAGTVWYLQFGGDSLSNVPKMVMSADPALAELGAAILRQTEAGLKLMGPIFGGRNPQAAVLDVLKTGAPLLIHGMELTTVSHAPIAADRFALPAVPETREQVRARFEANGGHIP